MSKPKMNEPKKGLKIRHGKTAIFVPGPNKGGFRITAADLKGDNAEELVAFVERKTGRELLGKVIVRG
ncbi:MAG TPA: hypothetical protein PLF80_13965 [Flavobacteriales bacterium]|nr:hypothetical protein [Flavobacteriales bacterium]